MTAALPAGQPNSAADVVNEFLRLVMIPDPDPASAPAYVAPDLRITFTGARAMREPAETSAFNASRHRCVKKRITNTEGVAGGSAAETVVYSLGTLYGEWPDGTPFAGNRYVDRHVVRRGRITQMDVWNHSAEWLLVRAFLARQ